MFDKSPTCELLNSDLKNPSLSREAKKGSDLSSVVSGIASNALLQAIIAGQNIRGKW